MSSTGDLGVGDPWVDLIGQPRAIERLQAATRSPVHAYLFVGPRGSGKGTAARIFAGELLAAEVADGEAQSRHRRLAHAGAHPDVITVIREGARIDAEQAREIVRRASRASTEGGRTVLILTEFHLVRDAGPILLKAIEEPPEGTHFLVLADEIPNELVTIASRCVRIDFVSVAAADVADRLVAEGASPDAATLAADASGGDLERARLLVDDAGLVDRVRLWQSIPDRLDGRGASVSIIVDEIVEQLTASEAPLEAKQEAEVAELAAREEEFGVRGSGRKATEDRHKREKRRVRLDELRFGLAVLARSYRDRLEGEPQRAIAAIEQIHLTIEGFDRNPNERLALEAMLLRLG